ncbi:sensor histidine kinase [uncultured Methylobacterium sp.]|uniref:sensor histidine kinase n=1 Tax=uncultured Methylobacterium sp. TaxID=157278 RepID=UPI0035CA9435
MPEQARIAELEAENAALRRRLAGAEPRPENPSQVVEGLHRSRNTLAMVRAMIRRSADGDRSAEDCVMRLDGRLGAIARVQSSGLHRPSEGIDLHSLIADELLAHLAREGEQAHLTGPKVRLQPRAADILALAVHELAVNAVEHGALTRADGRIHVAWRLEPAAADPMLDLAWTETGLAGLPAHPTRRGFGTEMLERTLRYEFGAETTIAYAPDGLRCTLRFALVPRIGRLADAGRADDDGVGAAPVP